MRLRGLDLNLLIVLDTVLEEQSVARASQRLNMSQPAVSSALSRLRHHFKDDLLVMKGRQLHPTAFAEALVDPVRESLTRLRTIASASPAFDPISTARLFTVVASEAIASYTVNDLARRLSENRYAASVRWLHNTPGNFKAFHRGDADILIVRASELTEGFPSRPLVQERFCCIAWTGHTDIQGAVSLEQYSAAEHILIEVGDPPQPTPADVAVANLGLERSCAIRLGSYGLAPVALIGTDLLATVPLAHARTMAQWLPIQVLPLPFEAATFLQTAFWHEFASGDPGVAWLLDELARAVAPMKDGGAALP